MLTILNPHIDDFLAEPLSYRLVGRRPLKKYEYLLHEPVKRFGFVEVLLDGTLSSVIPCKLFCRLPKRLRYLWLKFEIYIWTKINGLAGKVMIHWAPETVLDRRNLYIFSYKNFTEFSQQRLDYIEAFENKIVNLSHFMIKTAEKARNINKINNVVFTAESDISKTDYFSMHFGVVNKIVVLPFLVSKRFQVVRSFDARKDSCAATGSFHDLFAERPRGHYQDFLEFFELSTYHPVRKLVYHNKEALSEFVSCAISPFRESGFRFLRVLDIKQKKYFSFDIVAFYNDHKYALVGEEVYGFPAVGAFEAMASGCVLLGQGEEYYKGLNLRPNFDYLVYDGSLRDLKNKIKYLRNNPRYAQKLAHNGRSFANKYCNSEALYDDLYAKAAIK